MTKPTESLTSQMNRLDHAIKLEISKTVNVGLEAIVSSETKAAKAMKGE